jgi:hypothetical protein
MVNITIQNLEVESTALNQLSPGEIKKVVGGCASIVPCVDVRTFFRFPISCFRKIFC